MGAKCYGKMKELYQHEASPQKQLKVKDETLPISPQLLKAMVACKGKQANRQPMIGYLDMADMPNQKELVGILRWPLDLKAGTSAEQLRCCLDVMRWCSRLKLLEAFPEEVDITKPHFDETLVQAHASIMNMIY